jgi:hypothetical protein
LAGDFAHGQGGLPVNQGAAHEGLAGHVGRHELTQHLGVAWGPVVNGLADIEGIDAEVRELGTGKSRKSVLEDELRISPVEVAARLPINDGIDAVRRTLDQCWFDEAGCEQGLSCLTEYTKEYDERNGVFQQKPKHNWASHGADAFRTLAVLHAGHGGVDTAKGRDRYITRRKPPSWMTA